MTFNKKILMILLGTSLALISVSIATIFYVNGKVTKSFEEKMKSEKYIAFLQTIESVASELSIKFNNAISEEMISSLEEEDLSTRSDKFSTQVLGIANLLNSAFGLRQISVYTSSDHNLIHYSLEKNDLKFAVAPFRHMIRKVLDNERRETIQVEASGTSYLVSLIPGENEDEDIAHVYIMFFPIQTVLQRFFDRFENPAIVENKNESITAPTLESSIEILTQEAGSIIKNEDVLEKIRNKRWLKYYVNLEEKDHFLKGYQFVYFSDKTKLKESINSGLTVSFAVFFIFAFLIISLVLLYLHKMMSKVEHETQALSQCSDEIGDASRNLTNSSHTLANLNASQAQTVTSIASAVEEVSAMVQKNVEISHQSQEISTSIHEITQRGSKLNHNLVESVEDLSKSNDEIKKLVDLISQIGRKTALIDEIVFQTKILSFNAAIEAERAGDEGRGFSVVSQEIAKLAENSGTASAEISSIVRSSINEAKTITDDNDEKVERCGEIANKTSTLLDEISAAVETLKSNGENILEASKEQSTGVSQIASSMNRLDETTQSNSEAAAKNSNEAENLDHVALRMNEVVSRLSAIFFGRVAAKSPSSTPPSSEITEIKPRKKNQPKTLKNKPHSEKLELKPAQNDEHWDKL